MLTTLLLLVLQLLLGARSPANPRFLQLRKGEGETIDQKTWLLTNLLLLTQLERYACCYYSVELSHRRRSKSGQPPCNISERRLLQRAGRNLW